MNTKISPEDRALLRRKIRRVKEIEAILKPLEKEKDTLRDFIKTKSQAYERDFDFPEGRTEMRPSVRESYDKDLLDEMCENGTFDPDTASLVRRARKSQTILSMYIL